MVTFYPRTDVFPGIEDTGVDAFIVRFRRESTLLMWLGVVLGTFIFHTTPLLTVYVPLPAFLLPAGLRLKHASRILSTRLYLLRQGVFLVKLAAGLCWGADPAVRKQLGLAPMPADSGAWRQS
jgi:hypothetical protein